MFFGTPLPQGNTFQAQNCAMYKSKGLYVNYISINLGGKESNTIKIL